MKEKKENIYLWSVIVLAVLSALPLLWLSFYNHPSADDYMYAAETYRVWNETHSIWQVIKAAVQTSAEFYENWQGLYVSAFVLALQPAVFGEQFYALTGFFMLAILYGGNLFFCHQVFYRQLGCRRLESTAYGCMLSFVMVQWMPSVVQGLYWFNGAMNYVLFFALLEVFFCLLLTIQKDCGPRKNIGGTAAALVVGILLAGGNHITAFMGILVAAVFFVAAVLGKRRDAVLRGALPFVGILAGFFFNVSSPGTKIRQSHFTDTPGVMETIWYAIKTGAKMIDAWMGLAVILSFVLLVPFLLRAGRRIVKQRGFLFPNPLLVLAASAGFCCAMLCPPIYAMGTTGDLRITNLVYFSFVLLFFINVFYVCGWCAVRLGEGGDHTLPGGWTGAAAVLAVGILLACGEGMSSYQALGTIRSGEAAQYSAQAQERYERLRTAQGEDVVLEPFGVKPYLLYFDDITPDADDWKNRDLAEYFGLRSVCLREE